MKKVKPPFSEQHVDEAVEAIREFATEKKYTLTPGQRADVADACRTYLKRYDRRKP